MYAQLLAEASDCTEEQLADRLRDLLDSLLNLEAREALELLVLNDVLAPRPFRERLMSAAAHAFRWDESLHHLADLSLDAAREMHAWLAERAVLQSVPPPDGQQVETILACARDCFHMRHRKVPAADERRIAQTIRDMRHSFPTVLRYALDDEIVDYWLYRPDLSSAVLRGPAQSGPGAIASSAWGLLAVVVVFGALISLLNYSSGRVPYPVPSSNAPLPAQSFASRCDEVMALDSQHALLSPQQRETLKLCRAALHDALYGPESKLGLKPPQQLEERESPQPSR